MPDKLDRCVADVENDPDVDNPWAVCNASIDEIKVEDSDQLLTEIDDMISKQASFSKSDSSYKHSGNMVPTKSDHSYENTSAEENLKEIDDMLSKPATFPTSNSSFKHKTSGLVTRPKPNTFGNIGNETVSIPGSLSAVKIKGKKRESHSMQETIYKSVLDATMRLDGKLNSCGCKKKLKIKETTEGGVGSGRKRTLAHGAPTYDVPTAPRTPKAKPAMPATKTGSPKPATHFTDQENGNGYKNQDLKSIIDSKLNPKEEGGPGSGPRPGGGKKQPEPDDDDFRGSGSPAEQTRIADLNMETGDLVDFGAYGKLYILQTDAGMGDTQRMWVTDNEEDKDNPNAQGWYIEPYQAEENLTKKMDDEPDEDDDNGLEPGLQSVEDQIDVGYSQGLGYVDQAKSYEDLEDFIAQSAPDKKARDEVMSRLISDVPDSFARFYDDE